MTLALADCDDIATAPPGDLPNAFLAWGSTAGSQQACLLTACALYLLGTILVTVAGNVPLDDQLAAARAGAEAKAAWDHYLSRWTLWNHVRTAASPGAAGLLTVSLWRGAPGD